MPDKEKSSVLSKMLLVKCLCLVTVFSTTFADYWSDRESLIDNESSQMLGADVVLSAKEKIVNDYLMKLKLVEYDAGFDEPAKFLPSRHFFEARSSIEESEVFQFIRGMPKGGLLHIHEIAMLSFEGIYNMTYEKGLYTCAVNNRLQLRFLHSPTEDQSCDWQLLSDLRSNNHSYDKWLQSQLTLDLTNPKGGYNDINDVWSALNDLFGTVTPMITYRPFLEKYVYESLKELYEDRVTYVEIRSTLPVVYELDGTKHTPHETTSIFRDAVEAFKRDYPDFIGAKLIYAPYRRVTKDRVRHYVEVANELKFAFPDFVVGFDLAGQEDKGKPLLEFIDELRRMSDDVNLVFHAAETNWYGASTDLNLFDAILLGTKRIGHGFGITKHPLIMNLVKERRIAVEINPISNQVLMLVEDLRNHPAATLMSQGIPVVVGNDDPTFWGAKGLSYDFYMMFMGIASRSADLRLLKRLAENSFTYSFLSRVEKENAIKNWNKAWNQFIDSTFIRIDGGRHLFM